jgi:hypothetical protein
MGSSSQGVLRWIAYFWIAFLAYVVIGGAVAQTLGFSGTIGQYCADTIDQRDLYPACVPCGLNWSVFGTIELTPCRNPLLSALLTYGVVWPHSFVIALMLLVYPASGALREIALWLAPAVLLPVVSAALLRTIYVNFIRRLDVVRGLHRALVVSCVLLATIMAVSV